MLVLSRYANEGIVIGDDIRVIVVEIRGDKVWLGIQAPDDMIVDRDEIAVLRAKEGSRKKFPAGLVFRSKMTAANKEAMDLLARVAVGEYIDPSVIHDLIDRLRKAGGDVDALEWDNKRKSRVKGRRS